MPKEPEPKRTPEELAEIQRLKAGMNEDFRHLKQAEAAMREHCLALKRYDPEFWKPFGCASEKEYLSRYGMPEWLADIKPELP